ncbi:MAG: hypothetical protein MUF87_10170 [Anaerolineae bacterium]|jgi:hypothetical protein|nr:hypothetical protein [Anaerolineae bacterium]
MSSDAYVQALSLFDSALYLRESNPIQALNLFKQGRVFAEQVKDPCLLLEYDIWTGIVLLYYRRDYEAALAHIVKLVVEARKPIYDSCKQRTMAYRELIDAYLFYDPIGYRQQVFEATQLTEQDPAISDDSWCLTQRGRCYAYLMAYEYAPALEEGLRYLERCDQISSSFRLADAHNVICRIYAGQADWEQVAHHGALAETYAGLHYDARNWFMESLAWQALAAQPREPQRAASFHHRVLMQLTQMQGYPSHWFYDALCLYHEANQQWDVALLWRDRQLQEVLDGNSPYLMVECYLRRIALLGQLGRDTSDERTQALQHAQRLTYPEQIIKRLERL